MKRTTIFIDEPVERDLKALAERQGRPAAALVREAIGEYLAKRQGSPALPSFVAAGRSGHSDTAERHEELLWESGEGRGGADRPEGSGSRRRRRTRRR